MDVILGFGPLHDGLIAAALRGAGTEARACRAPDDEALAAGRARMARGHPSATHYLAGAAILHRRAHPAEALRFVTPGDRCGGYATDLARALADDGAPRATVLALAPERASSVWDDIGVEPARATPALLDAVAAGDLLDAACRRLAASGRGDETTALRVRAVAAELERALETGAPVEDVLRARRGVLRAPHGATAPRARVRVTGELLPTRYDHDVGGGLVRWLCARGVAVEAPTLCEWALYAAWRSEVARGATTPWRDEILRALHRMAEALGVTPPRPVDPWAWAAEAARWLPVSLCAGSGFMELATYLAADRDQSADLVLSLKPFASITSSAVSDAVLHALSRERATAFLSLELNGDLAAQLESRLELALNAARSAP